VVRDIASDRRQYQMLRDPQLANSYSYARNNPLIWKDKTGEFGILATLILIGTITGGAYLTKDVADWFFMKFPYKHAFTDKEREDNLNEVKIGTLMMVPAIVGGGATGPGVQIASVRSLPAPLRRVTVRVLVIIMVCCLERTRRLMILHGLLF